MTDQAPPIKQRQMTSVPSAAVMLLRAGFARKPKTSDPQLIPSLLNVKGVKPKLKQLERFREVCGFADDGCLPITFPQVMVTALQIQLMLEPEFPFSPLGIVHVRNEITQYKSLPPTLALDLSVQTCPLRITPSGYEFSLINTVSVDGEVAWQAIATILVPQKFEKTKATKTQREPGKEYEHKELRRIPGNKGRRYARASGDFNPIHLYTATAKMLGFKRHIAHGMWSKSRCVADLWNASWPMPVTVNVAFKLPVYLPATVTMMHTVEKVDTQGSLKIPFEMRGPNGRRPHVVGSIHVGDEHGHSDAGENTNRESTNV